jgi:hypothetical protein
MCRQFAYHREILTLCVPKTFSSMGLKDIEYSISSHTCYRYDYLAIRFSLTFLNIVV